MTSGLLLKTIFTLIFSGVLAYGVLDRDSSIFRRDEKERAKIYSPLISPVLFETYTLFLLILGICSRKKPGVGEEMVSLFLAAVIHMCLYYTVILSIKPLVRRHFSAKALALLWLLPNYLYIALMKYFLMDHPRVVLRIDGKVLKYVGSVWLAGCAVILIYGIVQHLIFRRQILKNAVLFSSPGSLHMWQEMQKECGIKNPRIPVKISDRISTPLSVGCFRFSTVLVLPHDRYGQDELKLIFRHELIHIVRQDSGTKFFLLFCKALCWFNPLLWISLKNCAQDLELSCDELVLEDCSEQDKQLYGDLILDTAGDERGFSTCLSADARSLKYRMENIFSPKKKKIGALLIGLLMFVMLMTFGCVSLAYAEQSVSEIIFDETEGRPCDVQVYVSDETDGWQGWTTYTCKDPDALTEYVMGLRTQKVSGYYSYEGERYLTLRFTGEKTGEMKILEIGERYVDYTPLFGTNVWTHEYYLPESPDWDYMMTLLEPAQ